MELTAQEIDDAILGLLAQRGEGKTICPSEAARRLGGDDGFRDLMDPVRDRAATLADRGDLEVTQKGEVVDLRSANGPIRFRLPRS